MNSLLATDLFHGNRMRSGYVLTVAVLIVQYSFTLSAHLATPINTVSVVGNRVKMECRKNSSVFPVNWEFASTGPDKFSPIYTSQLITTNLSSRYKIDTDNNTRYDIVIDSVDLSHAGTYRCTPITEEFVNKPSNSAQLIVLASDPICNTNASALNDDSIMEGDYIQMWCAVNFSGNWITVMEWTRNNGQIVEADVLHTNTSTTVASSLIKQLNSNDNGVTFTCKTTIKPMTTFNSTTRPGEVAAANVPDYQHLWNFKANVSYVPRNLTIIPMKNAYVTGDRLTCWANGNPTPDYKWMEIVTNRTISGPVLTIDDYMRSDHNHSFNCTACNTVAGLRRHIAGTVTFTVTVESQNAARQYIMIALIVVGSVFCLVFALFLCNSRCPFIKGRAGTDILRAVQGNSYAESREDQPVGRLRVVQATQPPEAEGYSLQQRHPFPLYAEVRREVQRPVADGPDLRLVQPMNLGYDLVKRETSGEEPCLVQEGATGCRRKQQDLSVYTEVVKNGKGSKNSEESHQTAKAAAAVYHSPKKTVTGADGTQYLDMTSIRGSTSRAPFRHPPMFSVVETYASIDHTFHAPSPLPSKRH